MYFYIYSIHVYIPLSFFYKQNFSMIFNTLKYEFKNLNNNKIIKTTFLKLNKFSQTGFDQPISCLTDRV